MACCCEGGVKLFEYHHSMLHQKVMLVDGCWCTVGTSNFDNRSFAHNEETSLCLCDTRFVAAMTALFEEDLAGSQPVVREDVAAARLGHARRRNWSRPC